MINPDNCDGTRSTQDFIADIVHEAIHARMFNDCWPEGISYDDYKAGFLECVEIYYLVNTDNITEETHHNIMADRFIVDIAKGIAAYFGSTNWEDFEYLAWHGLKQYPEYANEQWFKVELKNAKTRYDEISPTLIDPCTD